MKSSKNSKRLLVVGLSLTGLGILLSFALGRDIGNSDVLVEIGPPTFLTALFLGSALSIAGCAILSLEQGRANTVTICGLALVVTSFTLPFLLKLVGLEINVHLWTMSLSFPVAMIFCGGCILFLRGYSRLFQVGPK